VEEALTKARSLLLYLSSLQSCLSTVPPVLSPSSRLATVARQLIKRVGDVTDRLMGKREARRAELGPVLARWRELVTTHCTQYTLCLGEEGMSSLADRLESVVTEVCEATRLQSRQPLLTQAQSQRNGAANRPWGDGFEFDDFDDLSNDSHGMEEEASLELEDVRDQTEELAKLETVSACLSLLATLGDRLTCRQGRTVQLLLSVLDSHSYSPPALALAVPVVSLLTASPLLTLDTVEELTTLLSSGNWRLHQYLRPGTTYLLKGGISYG
jgi:hypothetical protein